jgi:hypothetical protein
MTLEGKEISPPVMPALVARIHIFLCDLKTWMAGASPAMTRGYDADDNIRRAGLDPAIHLLEKSF